MLKILENLEKYFLYIVILLFPIAVLSISPNPFVPIKLAILTFSIAIILIIKSARVIVSGKLTFFSGNFDLPVFLLAIAYIVSAIFRTQSKMEAFFIPGTATAIAAGALFYYLLNQLVDKEKAIASKLLFTSGTIFAVLSLLAYSGIFAKIPQLPNYVKDQAFNPEGGFLPTAIFLTVLLPIGLSLFFSEKEIAKKALVSFAGLIITFGLAISIYNLLPGQPSALKFPSFGTYWSITIDSLKEQPFLGIGPGNYLTAFNRFRPLSVNNTNLWALKFATARDFYLTLFTETGLLGAAGIIFLIIAAYKLIKDEFKKKEGWLILKNASLASLVLLLILFIPFPATNTLMVMLFILLSLSAKTHSTSLTLSTQVGVTGDLESAGKIAKRIPSILVTLPIIVLAGVFVFYASRVLSAEYQYKKGLDALVRNDAVGTYDLIRQAINLNPYEERYHSTYSRVNLALVSAIATKKEITDQDKANIAQLVQQAIREAKATVALNPLRAGNWELLGRTYQTIIPLASGADAFAIQSMRQAVVLDPINPLLRIGLGGMYYAKNDYENAQRVFELAVATKPDLANAHYNLAFALQGKGQIEEAIQQMTLVLSLVDKNSQDYQAAKTALEDLEKKRPAAKEATETLTPPQEAEKPVIKPPIELPEGSQPPETPITPTPTP